MITAYGSVEVAVDALKRGANDYFSKPWDNEKLLIEIDRMIAKRRLERENTELKRALKQRYSFPNIVGKSERMLKILDLVAQVAASRATILITGETGTGKELIANAIHAHSARAEHPFVPVHSGSVPPDLLESALFGHVKGAFTGAMASRKGYFEIANHGTIFFDEIGTISLETQTKLLRVIQEREFMPLGSTETIKVDVRIVAATNADLKKLVEEGKFREDLYYRLNVINLALPPLRDRKEDIPALVEHFFTKYCRENEKFLDEHGRSRLRFEPDAMQILMDHAWPGNVRELENVVERAVVLASQPSVPVDVLPEHLLEARGPAHPPRRKRQPAGRRVAVRDRRGFRAPQDHRATGSFRLEPDRRGRGAAHSAFDAESEDQAPEHRDPEAYHQPVGSGHSPEATGRSLGRPCPYMYTQARTVSLVAKLAIRSSRQCGLLSWSSRTASVLSGWRRRYTSPLTKSRGSRGGRIPGPVVDAAEHNDAAVLLKWIPRWTPNARSARPNS